MHRAQIVLIAITFVTTLAGAEFSGSSALELTRKVVTFGQRPPGTNAHRSAQAFIRKQLAESECEVGEDSFEAATPNGKVHMTNIIARFPGTSGKAIVVSGHYDTKVLPEVRFVGANDAGSSTGFLLEMARALDAQKRTHDVYLVWFDGEEAFGTWSDTDGVYGSRHLARKWSKDGTLQRIVALINVDMIGDKELGIVDEHYSTRSLALLVRQAAVELGVERHFLRQRGAIQDDHVPFLQLGVSAIDLIDFDYGPQNSYWHTGEDTMDKLDAGSFQVVGEVVLRVIEMLEARP